MLEGRRPERARSLLRAQIIFNQSLSTIECVVKNISATGAKLALSDTLTVPSEFDVHIPQKGKTYHARMVWRDTAAIGVEFIQPEAHTEDGAHPEQSLSEIEKRMRALQLQNAELKIRVRELSKRLEDLGQDPNIAA